MVANQPIYYVDQTGWGPDEFSYLNSYLNRLFLYEGDADKSQRIASMDTSLMTRETLAIISALLHHYGKASAARTRYPNLQAAIECAPLPAPL